MRWKDGASRCAWRCIRWAFACRWSNRARIDTDIWERNVVIAKGALDPASPNKERSQRFAEFVKNSAKHRRDAREVAQLIVRIARESESQAALPHRRRREGAGLAEANRALAEVRTDCGQGGEDRLRTSNSAVSSQLMANSLTSAASGYLAASTSSLPTRCCTCDHTK